ncbi:acetate--CoA ligase family protein [Streptomyces sp. NBC_01016]|uniref:acetate--CoA ligase family protein n=1 Tax=Streptomyces sp. NBC_01016 TaxID=2903720 RepID=UPI002253354D|nr:acetate--CoA ligase family protein [Streptomyces sp. NBC_01016]MCX4835083.1 acetate--CoA ligase family protein [Streptomyces sp. NBC_01016]
MPEVMRCEPLFRPKSIAVVGVSASQELSWGRITVKRLLSGGYEGDVYAVTRGELTLPGVRTVGALAEIGHGPDLVVLATPAATVPGLLREAREAGAGAAIVYASGFAEEGDEQLQDELRAAAGDMPVLGPNCLGLVSRPAGVQVSTTVFLDRERSEPGPVAIVTQSGAVGFVLADLLERAGLGYSYYASVGNEACLSVGELGGHLLAQPDVEVLVLYLEGVRDAAGLRELGRLARQSGKTVVALTVGRSAAGRRAALSHTAAVAGDHLLLASLCRQEGIRLVTDDDQLVDAVLCARRGIRLPPAPRLAVLTMSGGAGGVLADNLTAMGVRIPPLSAETRSRLAAIGGVEATDANPVDLGGNLFRWMDRVEDLLGVLDEDPELDGVVLYLTFGDLFPEAYHRLARAAKSMRTPAWFVWACAPSGELEQLGMPETVVGSMGAFLRRLRVLVPEAAPAKALRQERPAATRWAWSELRSAPLTEAAGIAHVPTVSAASADGLVAEVRRSGWQGPYVLKGDAADVPHRARHGLVRVGVEEGQLAEKAAELAHLLETASTDPGRRLVSQPLLEHTAELALGATHDSVYGTALLLGAGGDRAEDPAAPRRGLLLPATDDQIRELADWAAFVLDAPAEATVRAVTSLTRLLDEHPGIEEVDINPLCVVGDRLIAVDALITHHEEEGARK